MKFYNRIISKEISLFCIDDFDVKQWYDISQLKNVYKCLFRENDVLFSLLDGKKI